MPGRGHSETIFHAVIVATCLAAPLGAEGTGPLPLRADSLLAATAFTETNLVAEFSPAGALIGMVELIDPGMLIDSPSGLTRIGDEYWIGGGNGVHRLNPATGEVSPGFAVAEGPTLTAVTNDGEFLLVGQFTTNALERFDTAGHLIDTITLDTPGLFMVGADSDGSLLYIGSHSTGDVHVFDMAGITVGVIETNLPSDLTGVALDQDGETLWVATGVGSNDIHRFDFAGNLLTTFPGQLPGIMGLVAVAGQLFADGFEAGDTSAWSDVTP